MVTTADDLVNEYQLLLHKLMGPRIVVFEQALDIYRLRPMGGAEFLQRYIRLFYPNYDVHVTVIGMPKLSNN